MNAKSGMLMVLVVGLFLCGCDEGEFQTPELEEKMGAIESQVSRGSESKLAVIWYSDDPYVAERVCLMYTHAAKSYGWFDQVKLILWGPSQQLFVDNTSLQATVAQMQSDGVSVDACQACADMYGFTDDLEALGINVQYMGSPLTDMLQGGWSTLTF